MVSRSFFISCLAVVSMANVAQDLGPRDKFWTGGFNVGTLGWSPSNLTVVSGDNHFSRTLNYGLGNLEDVNGKKSLAFIANTSIGAHGGFMWRDKHSNNYTSIELELQNNKACYEFTAPFAFGVKGDSMKNWVESDKYLKASVALQRSWYLQKYSSPGSAVYGYVRESFGQTFLHRNFGDAIRLNHTEDWTAKGTGMISQIIAVSPSSYMLASEIGLRSVSSDKKYSLDLGLVYYAPFQATFTERYEFFKDNQSVGKSTITFNGGTLMLNLRYTINRKIESKPVDSSKVKKTDPITQVHKVNGRHVDVQDKMNVTTDLITVKVWDRGNVDGDKIALYLNGELILDDYTLSKEKKEVELHLRAGVNYLAMHAINLGTIPPNTAAMEISDGKKKKNITVISDTGKSGAIEITYTP